MSYPSAPGAEPRKQDGVVLPEHVERREWFLRRNKAIQAGVPQPASGSFGKPPKS